MTVILFAVNNVQVCFFLWLILKSEATFGRSSDFRPLHTKYRSLNRRSWLKVAPSAVHRLKVA